MRGLKFMKGSLKGAWATPVCAALVSALIGQAHAAESAAEMSDVSSSVCRATLLTEGVTPGGKRPVTVFYVTDGARLGPAVDGVCRLLAGTKGASSDCAVAAVDVPDRTAFLTPTASSLGRNGLDTGKVPEGGRAAELVECLEKTVKPAVSRALEGRKIRHALMGHSFGGLFALSTMVSRPDLFDAWVAADPSLWWDGGVLLKRLEARAGAGAPDGFVYAGFATALRKTEGTTAQRNLTQAERFRKALEGFAGPNARLQVDDYPRETHGTIAVPVFHEAMKRLLIGEAPGRTK